MLQGPFLLQNLCRQPVQMRWQAGQCQKQMTLYSHTQHQKDRQQEQHLLCQLHEQSDSGSR